MEAKTCLFMLSYPGGSDVSSSSLRFPSVSVVERTQGRQLLIGIHLLPSAKLHTHTHTLSQRACVHMLMSWTPGLDRDRGPQWHWCNNDCSLLTWPLLWSCRVILCCTAKQIPTIFNWYKVELLKLYGGNLFIIVCINSVIVQGVDLFLDQKSLIITANYAISKTNLNNSL